MQKLFPKQIPFLCFCKDLSKQASAIVVLPNNVEMDSVEKPHPQNTKSKHLLWTSKLSTLHARI